MVLVFLQFTASLGGDGRTEGQTEVDEGGRRGRSMWREAARWNDLSAGQQITRKKISIVSATAMVGGAEIETS